MFLKKNITLIFILFFSNTVSAQPSEKWNFLLYGKNHQFYDNGVYNIKDNNNATGYGVGLRVGRTLNRRLSLTGGYSYALADSLKYENKYTNNAVFHQLDLNLAFHFKQRWRLNPYLYSGYSYNYIPKLKIMGIDNNGININLGTGFKLRVYKHINLGYDVSFAFRLSENIPYNINHKFGIYLHPIAKNKTSSPILIQENTTVDSIILVSNKNRAQADSLEKVLNSISSNTKNEGHVQNIAHKKLLIAISSLEQENQLLINELRNRRQLDSNNRFTTSEYQIYDKYGIKTTLNKDNLSRGYYFLIYQIPSLLDAKELRKNKSITLPHYYLMNNNQCSLLIFTGESGKHIPYINDTFINSGYNTKLILL